MGIVQSTGNGWTNTYTYDASRRLTGVSSPAGSYGYQFTGPGTLVARLDQPGGFWITNTFDSRGRLTDTTLYDNTSTILNRHGYVLNHAHQRTTITRTNYAASTYNGKVDYTYDNAGEVRTARAYDGSGTAVPSGNFDYGYDAGWNILKRTNNTAETTYTVNNLNQITGDGGASWGHDNNGNLTWRPRSGGYNLSYTYDDENQLLSVSSANQWKEEFTYDGRGRMRVKKDFTWSGTLWVPNGEVWYVYDGMLIVQERNNSSRPLVTYTRGTDLSGGLDGAGGIGGLLSRGAHATTSPFQLSTAAHYHADGNGNVTMLVGTGSPTIKGYYRYDPFGRTLASGGSLAGVNAMRFSSKPAMGSSDLYCYGYRFHDPSSQRWLNRDPLEEEGGLNLYGFNFNNPLSWIDTDGRGSIANPASAAVAAEAEAAALGYPSYAAMQAALREVARKAAVRGAAMLALAQSQCKPKNDDPCKRLTDLRNYITQNHRDVLTQVSNVIKAKGTQADLNQIPGLTPELQAMIAAMYQAAVDCHGSRRDNTFNEARVKFLRGETSTGPGKNTIK